jgi:hypothetical protein
MDKAAFVHKRKKRYMAEVLGTFEEHVQEHVSDDVAEMFKGLVRQKMHALALDAALVLSLKPGEELNGASVDLRDQVEGRNKPRGVTA